MSTYPEHEKLHNVRDESRALGEFLDLGLPQLGIVLYEDRTYECECSACDARRGDHSQWHTEQERETAVRGRVQLTGLFPTRRTVNEILAEYFEIDQKKIDDEKDQMLRDIREMASP